MDKLNRGNDHFIRNILERQNCEIIAEDILNYTWYYLKSQKEISKISIHTCISTYIIRILKFIFTNREIPVMLVWDCAINFNA
jgi:hypothetical protein